MTRLLLGLTLLLSVAISAHCLHNVVTGGKSPITAQDAEGGSFQNAITEVTRAYNTYSNSMFHHAMLRYEDAKKQVVAGIRYTFVAVFVETPCRKAVRHYGSPLRWCKEKLSPDAKVYRCPVSVVYRPWSSPRQYEVDRSGLESCQQTRRLKRSEPLQHQVLLGGDSHDIGHYGQFAEFKRAHGKVYASRAEEQRRFAIFRDNMKKAYAYQMLDRGDARYGASVFADLTQEEFRSRYLSPRWDLSRRPAEEAAVPTLGDLPTSFDWREKGAVTEVKNQGTCGSCWAFSTTGNIEGQWFINKKKLVDLSEQQLVDCDKVDEGCNGGLPSQAYKEIERMGGLMKESDYPYRGSDQKCQFNQGKVAVYINSSVAISKDEKAMAAWLVQNGPISIGINANAMQFYLSGISHPWKIFCNPSHLDHGVLIVGYGMKGTEPYWIIKNSWGTSWGNKGYYLVYRGDGTCGLNQMCTSAQVK
ncbi:hypothetical protein BOX15_Mlig021148g1 [Macrostomum lignano]|uniref:Cathepsin F n=1 Tax=Macrostomum lignano TaxID=282301 RepID=A0A267FSZ7_9PLAT|nr:hypothetical protein BOX15_Mlig021148g1 [Macrostomum lignano]